MGCERPEMSATLKGFRCPRSGEGPPPWPAWLGFCSNGPVLQAKSMGAAIYLALLGGGLSAAVVLTLVLRGVRLI